MLSADVLCGAWGRKEVKLLLVGKVVGVLCGEIAGTRKAMLLKP